MSVTLGLRNLRPFPGPGRVAYIPHMLLGLLGLATEDRGRKGIYKSASNPMIGKTPTVTLNLVTSATMPPRPQTSLFPESESH